MIRRKKLWLVPAFVTLLFTSVTGDSGRLPAASSEGITVTRTLPFVVESLGEVSARGLQGDPGDRPIRFHRTPRPAPPAAGFATRLASGVATSLGFGSSAPVAAPRAPALDCSFAGLGNPTTPGSDVVPPDTMGAAGPNHLVSILNSDFGVFDKATGLSSGSAVSLTSFWDSVWDLPPVVPRPPPRAFDPKILYDTHSGRFIAVTLAGLSGTDSWLLVAVSTTSNPLDNWVKLKIDADLDNNAQQFSNSADFPGLGVDNTNIYISANMYDDNEFFQYSKVWAIPKDQFLAGSLPSPLTWHEFRNPPPQESDSTMQPAHTFDNTSAEYFVFERSSGILRLASITFPGGTPTWSYLGQVSVTPFNSTFALPDIPQLGNDNGIDPGDTRLLNAVYRNGSLWTTHHVAVGGKIEVGWYQINPLTASVVNQGRVSDPSRWYAYPSIAVNKDGDAAIGFSGSSATEYMSAYYTSMKAGSGTTQPVSLLKSGEAPYYKTLGGAFNRWGDFSATVVDPSDNLSFWTLQEYAETPANGKSMWGTWWGKFRPPSIAAPTSLTATAVSPTQINLAWTDLSSDELGFKVERRLAPAGDYSVIATLGVDNTSYIDNTGVTGGSTYSYRVQAFNASGGSYSGEAVATAQTPPPAPSGEGGGGGCSMATEKEEAGNLSSLISVLVLLSPIAILALRRKARA